MWNDSNILERNCTRLRSPLVTGGIVRIQLWRKTWFFCFCFRPFRFWLFFFFLYFGSLAWVLYTLPYYLFMHKYFKASLIWQHGLVRGAIHPEEEKNSSTNFKIKTVNFRILWAHIKEKLLIISLRPNTKKKSEIQKW